MELKSKIKQLNFKAPFLIFMAVLIGINTLVPSKSAFAHTGYYISIAPNIQQMQYTSVVVADTSTEFGHNELSFANAVYYRRNIQSLTLPLTNNYDEWKKLTVYPRDSSTGYAQGILTFPAHVKGNYTGYTKNNQEITVSAPNAKEESAGTELDREAATNVSKTLVTTLNTATSFISSEIQKTTKVAIESSGEARRIVFFDLTGQLANVIYNIANGGKYGEIKVNEVTFSITLATEADQVEHRLPSNYDDYVVIKNITSNTAPSVLQYRMEKYDDVNRWNAGVYNDVHWGDLILHGNSVNALEGITGQNISAVRNENPDILERAVVSLLDSLVSGIYTILGLDSMADLVFNQGARNSVTWLGVAPSAWFDSSEVLFWISQILAWILLFGALIKTIGDKMIGTVNPYGRVTLIEGVKDLFIAAFGLTLIVPVFQLLATFNYQIVDIFANVSVFNDNLNAGTFSGGTITGALVSLVYVGAEIYFNFMYILRGITLAILYGVSPLFVVCYAFGGKIKLLTFRFFKEVVGNIFVQTFHAILLTFFGLYMAIGLTGGFFEQLVVVYSFIPLTSLFRALTGIGESDFIKTVAQQSKDRLTNTATAIGAGVVSGVVAGATAGSSGKSAGGQGNVPNSKIGKSTSNEVGGDNIYFGGNEQIAQAGKFDSGISGDFTAEANNQKQNAAIRQAKAHSDANEEFGKSMARTTGGLLKTGAGMALMAAGGLTGNNEISRLGKDSMKGELTKMTGRAKGVTSDAVGELTDNWKGIKDFKEHYHPNDTTVDNGGGYISSTTIDDKNVEHAYGQELLREELGVTAMSFTDDSLIMSYDTDKLEQKGQLEMLKYFMNNSNNGDTQKVMKNMGIKKVGYTDAGDIAVAYDANQKGVSKLKKVGDKYLVTQKSEIDSSKNFLGHAQSALKSRNPQD